MIDATIAATCLARFSCRQHNVMCSLSCPLYIDVRYQLALSGIPDEYRGITVESLPDTREHMSKLREFVAVASERKPRNGLFLTSATTGNGKTEAACAIAQSYIVARAKKAVNGGSSANQLVQFVNVTALLDLLRAGMNSEDAHAQASALLSRVGRAEVIVLDDLGAERPTEYVQERLYSLINGIWENRTQQTILATSNRTLEAIELTLGPRIRSRVDGLTVKLEFTGSDKRRKTY